MNFFSSWVVAVRTFAEAIKGQQTGNPNELRLTCLEVDSVLEPADVKAISKKWSTGLPQSLCDLWLYGSGSVRVRYFWTPRYGFLDERRGLPRPPELLRLAEVFPKEDAICGGPCLIPAKEVDPRPDDWAASFEHREDAAGRLSFELWTSCVVFLWMKHGDGLGLDLRSGDDDPPVVYLCHEAAISRQIAPSFTEFLRQWHELRYLGPELWLIEPWLNSKTGWLDADCHDTAGLQKLFPRIASLPR
jgi:hypothetical protein